MIIIIIIMYGSDELIVFKVWLSAANLRTKLVWMVEKGVKLENVFICSVVKEW